ncbi:laccase domain protein [Cellulomonas soli]|uniref:Purine nucleoside phosphorylase n=1 Tax=Cellulomonas soli TaxID=931535 RepID=A0A512PBR5_9CELL|nr:laccase domain protein [Cellulomonas soli]
MPEVSHGLAEVIEVDLGPGVRAGFTTRAGGVSPAPWDTLNLGTAVQDDPGRVVRNRERVAGWVGAPVVFATQVHGAHVLQVDAADATAGTGDALVSGTGAIAVAVLVADCVPVLLADARAGVVAAVHAGRGGLVAGVVDAAVAAMVARGAQPGRIRAAVGPSIAGVSYEVPAELRDEVAARHPATWATTSWGTPALDLPAGVLAELERLGLRDVLHVARDTWTDDALFSHRRAGGRPTGRFAGVVRAPV